MLIALADYASISIYNARLYQDLGESRDQIEKWGQDLEAKISERTAALEATQTQLHRSETLAALGHMAAGLAQEMGDPINTILGHVRVLESKLAGEDQPRISLEAIERETLRCQTTMKSLLDFAKRTPPETQPVDMNELTELAWRLVDDPTRPSSIGQVDGLKRSVFLKRHGALSAAVALTV